ncbi:MAG TPA: cyclic peptide export ABC transporter [Thermoanaerobaculia bacterium]|nr:cyclic peptide export ABC transporter [Thermoanaerobaculia bacterium]
MRSARDGRTRAFIALIVVTGILSGVASTAFIALINQAVHRGTQSSQGILLWFLGFLVLLPVARFVSNALLVRVSQRMFHEMRIDLCRRILAVPLRRLEQLGPSRLLASLTEDVGTIGNALGTLPMLSMHITIVVCCLVYMGWLSWQLLLLVLAFFVVGLSSYLLPVRVAARHFELMRRAWDSLLAHLRGLTEGSKELKLHRERRRSFLADSVEASSLEMCRHTVIGHTIHAAASGWSSVLSFILIGTVVFGVPRVVAIDSGVLTGFLLAILYMLSPVEVIVTYLPGISRANIAVGRVEELGGDLSVSAQDPTPEELAPPSTRWSELELRGVRHSYFREQEEDQFTMGPIDLKIAAGELIFLVGGNGSGKTTLAKLLTGLYIPESGEIRLDGVVVNDEGRDQYRQLFSAVFQDFFLFELLHGLDAPQLDERARGYLSNLLLDRKVKVENGRLSTLDLSQGQRKRLALLTAYLEDRPIYLFDEWAADQDPQFKKLFYLKLLPELKARGKTVIAISHDDRYYELGDRIVKLDYGQVEFDGPADVYLETFGEKAFMMRQEMA